MIYSEVLSKNSQIELVWHVGNSCIVMSSMCSLYVIEFQILELKHDKLLVELF